MLKRSELTFGVAQIPIDMLMLWGAFYLAYTLRAADIAKPLLTPLSSYQHFALYLIPLWVVIFAGNGLYNLRSTRSFSNEFGRIVLAASGALMAVILLGYLTPNPYFTLQIPNPIFPSKIIPIYILILSVGLISIGRLLTRLLQRSLFKIDIGVHRALLIGANPEALQLLEKLQLADGIKMVGVLDQMAAPGSAFDGLTITGRVEELEAFLSKNHLDDLIIADSGLPNDQLINILELAERHQLGVKILPTTFGIFSAQSRIATLAGLPMVELAKTPLEGWGRVLKRIFDILGASFGLVVFSPLFLIIAILVKLSDAGPVFYRHKRLGRGGKFFSLFKFRSMYMKYSTGEGFTGKTDAEVFAQMGHPELTAEFDKLQKLSDDPRVTPIGKFLRKYSLDELAQLINVLAGDMSLVGPRPIVEAELAKYGALKHSLLLLKPGLTGLWQVSGRTDVSYEERVKLDAYYIERWSLLQDIVIILKTFKVFLGRDSAGY